MCVCVCVCVCVFSEVCLLVTDNSFRSNLKGIYISNHSI